MKDKENRQLQSTLEDLKEEDFYKEYQKAVDILERTYIALGRKKKYRYIFQSTSDCEINLPPSKLMSH